MRKLTKSETLVCAAAILSGGMEPEDDVLIGNRPRNPNDCQKCGFGLSAEWSDGRRICDDCDHEWFKTPDSSDNLEGDAR